MKSAATAVAWKKRLAWTAGAVAALLAVAIAVRGGQDLRALEALKERVLAALQRAGPWAFFSAMALLPAAGAPMGVFSLAAGPAFAARMGMVGVVAAGLTALTVNLLLTYWLARQALRPALTRLVERLGYRIPQLDAKDMTDLIVLLRVTPGPPFFVQNYLLGLADAPFVKYVAISCAAQWTYTAVFIRLWRRASGRARRGHPESGRRPGRTVGGGPLGAAPLRRKEKGGMNPADPAERPETVTEFTRRVKTVLETGIGPGWIRGEVSNLRAQASGHFYFSLKDAGAQLSAVLSSGATRRAGKVPLRDGRTAGRGLR